MHETAEAHGPARAEANGGAHAAPVDDTRIRSALEHHRRERAPRLQNFWGYFRNHEAPAGHAPLDSPAAPPTGGGRRLFQERGLPRRLTGDPDGLLRDDRQRREIVIENDIAWRIQTMVDFLFGREVRIVSRLEDETKRTRADLALAAAWEASGGLALLQDVALLGHVYGYVDLVLRLDEDAILRGARTIRRAIEAGRRPDLRGLVEIEPIEPRRGAPVPSERDWRTLDALLIAVEREVARPGPKRPERVRRLFGGRSRDGARRERVELLEVIERGGTRFYEGGELRRATRSVLLPGHLPVVHVQNLSQPFCYEGIGEVEGLIPLQDELNTRLSDRASRVTLQSFRMYLAKGLDGFADGPVGPGQVFSTDNHEASIEAFGGDGESPSESEHVAQIREALDRSSAVPPVASGSLQGRVGNLSSGNALRITMLGLITKTERKRITYGHAIERLSAMVLAALDRAGALPGGLAEAGARVVWPDVLPLGDAEAVRSAQTKVELGVDRGRVLAELGYGAPEGAEDEGSV
ncbi:MAG: hypothetical protein AAFR38_13335 [Planctomycetota bacterium]